LIYRAGSDGLELRRRKEAKLGEGLEGRWDRKAKGEERAFKLLYYLLLVQN
jgi:hypothetical protein